MSNPPNPLADYRSVSYYHVLAICDTTSTAAKLSTLTDENAWRHATTDLTNGGVSFTDYSQYGKYAPKTLLLDSADRNGQREGRYSILIDGSSDAEFSITEASWLATTTGAVTPNDRGTSIAIEGTLRVSEPRGVVFADTIVSICRALKVNSSNAIFVLKTFFVGHAHSNIGESDLPQTITDIDPYVFTVIDLQGTYTELGGTYEIVSVGQQHGTGRLPQYSTVSTSINVKTGTLVETFASLEKALETSYSSLVQCVRSTISQSITDPAIRDNVLSRLSTVRYKIVPDQNYQSSEYFVSVSPNAQDKPDCGAGGALTFPAQYSIEDMISNIMFRSEKVKAESYQTASQSGRSRDPRYTFKVHTNVDTEVATDDGDKVSYDITVTYNVVRYPEPRSFNFYSTLLGNDDGNTSADEGLELIKQNTIEFDYLYTGKNTDILEFNMNMSLGLAYLQIATSSNSTRDHLNSTPVKKQSLPNNHVVPNDGTPIPIFFGSNIVTDVFRNTNTPSAGIQSAYTLSKHSSLESIEVSMKVYGNPSLLNTVNKASYVKSTTSPSTNTSVLSGFTNHPSFAKVNVRMPRTNDDIALFQALSGGDGKVDDFTKEFWFDGYYYIYAITNIFDNGFFYQQLHMLGIPSRLTLDNSADARDFELTLNDNIGKCFDTPESAANNKTTPMLSEKPPAKIEEDRTKKVHVGGYAKTINAPKHASVPPSNTRDAQSVLRAAKGVGPEGVRGFNEADPIVKQSIISAQKYSGHPNVDSTMLARIAAAENSFRPSGKNPKSSATGLFQFSAETWKGLIDQNKVPGIDPSEASSSEALQKRNDPNYAAGAVAKWLSTEARNVAKAGFEVNETNMYVIHHFGGPTGLKILQAARNPNTKLRDVLSTETYDKVMKANPHLQKYETAQDIVGFAAGKMAATVPGGIKVATTTPAALGTATAGTQSTPVSSTQAGKTAGDSIKKVQALNDKKPIEKCKTCADSPIAVNSSKGKV